MTLERLSDRFEHVLEPDEDEKPVCLKPTILKDIIDRVKNNVREVVNAQSKGPRDYIKEYDKFIYLIDGKAEAEIEQYIKESHTFEELSAKAWKIDITGSRSLILKHFFLLVCRSNSLTNWAKP